MANESIGSAALQLSTDAKDLNAGLDAAQNKISGWITQVNSKVSYVGGGVWGAVVGAATTAFSKIKSTWGELQTELKDIVSESKMAQSFGLSFERFGELMAGTRLGANDLRDTLTTLSTSLSMAAVQGGRAAQPLRALGFNDEGMRDLSRMPVDSAFTQIAEKIRQVESPMHQMRLAMQLFGANGATALQAIRSGMDANIERAKQYGLIIGDDQVEAAQRAGSAFRETQQITTGMFRQLAIAVSPFVEIMNTAIKNWWQLVQPLFRILTDSVASFAGAVSRVWATLGDSAGEFLTYVKEFWGGIVIDIPTTEDAILAFFSGVYSYVGMAADKFLEFGAGFANNLVVPMLDGLSTLASGMASFVEMVGTGFITPIIAEIRRLLSTMELLSGLDPTGTISSSLRTAREGLDALGNAPASAADALRGVGRELGELSNDVGQSARIMLDGANVEENIVNFFDRARARVREANRSDPIDNLFDPEMMKRALDLTDKFQDPMEKMKKSLRDLKELFDAGLIDANTFGQASEDAIKQAESALKVSPDKFSALMTQGSSAAVNLLYHRNTEDKDSPVDRVRALTERGNQQRELQVQASQQMVELLRDRPELVAI